MIKGGKPITPTAVNGEAPKLPESPTPVAEKNGSIQHQTKDQAAVAASPTKSVNGKTPANGAPDQPGQLDLKRATVNPTDASQVERVKLNKKPKCKCCVIQ